MTLDEFQQKFVEKIKRYAKHDSDCTFWKTGKSCSCGLYELLGLAEPVVKEEDLFA